MLYRFVYWFIAPCLVGPFLRLFNRVELIGWEHLPPKGPAVIIANHISGWDSIYLYCFIRRPLYFMAKAELFAIPVLGWLLRRIHVFPVKRDAIDRAALRKSAAVLGEGHMLVLFPEGTRSKAGQLQPFKEGAALFAHRAQAPVIPLAMQNTPQTFPRAFRQPIRILCGPPIALEKYQGQKADSQLLKAMTAEFRQEISRLKNQAAGC
jgi:1-acyl-sn-glycerol-3-phosphate acyltransferase